MKRWAGSASTLSLLLLAGGCAGPVVGFSVESPKAIHRYLTQSALSANEPSVFSLVELRRYELLELVQNDPDLALSRLRELALAQGLPPDALFALAELSFLRAEHRKDPGLFAAAALYAYAYLFPEEPRKALDALDPRARWAADLYNRSLAEAAARDERGIVTLRKDGLDLPFGHFRRLPSPPPDLGGYAIEGLQPVAELAIHGLRNRYRRPGIGAPLGARLSPTEASAAQPVQVGRNVQMPLTAVAVIENPLAQIRSGDVTARFVLLPTLDVDTIEIAGRAVPLEAEPSAALAVGLTESRFWQTELAGFLGKILGVAGASGIGALRPYKPDRIPVVFVHGTASSPGRWADMANDLIADSRLRHRYAFWFFRYDSGQPIAYSAWQLRDALARGVERADPKGTNPCLRDMVVMGHSQGGLLTKMAVIESGDRFWHLLTKKPFDEVRLADDDRVLLRNALFVHPLPFVRRVVFLATPHRGSYLAGPQIVQRLAQRLVRLPSDLVRVGADLATLNPTGAMASGRVSTSIDNMSPSNPFIKMLATIPVVPDVPVHSIISVDDDEPLSKAGDGVVKYESAHIEPVESQLIVRSPHSGMQGAPATIEEVRRILLEHSAGSRCPLPDVRP